MSKKKFNESNKVICEYIINDYVRDADLDETHNLINNLPMLVTNNLACRIAGTDDVSYASAGIYKVASMFIQKYNKSIKHSRRKLKDYEFGGSENVFAKNDKRLIELAKYSLEAGRYFAQLSNSTYCVFIVTIDEKDDYVFNYELYFIGKKWTKWKDKFYKLVDEYADIKKSEKIERIYYTNGTPAATTVFKSFDQVIFKDKDKVLKYIDNWVNNIPIYYDEYKMISKLSIILYGSPGTGKSTFCKALANYLDIDSVTSVTPEYFSQNIDGNRGRGGYRSSYMETVYALDDVDCVCKSREISDSKENDATLANLLAFLDNPPTFFYKAKNGIRYPISIVIATTNYYDKLDDAVKRYGRFDFKIEMQNFRKEEAQAMCDIYKLKLEDIVPDCNKKNFTISPSYLQALCLENIDKSMKSID